MFKAIGAREHILVELLQCLIVPAQSTIDVRHQQELAHTPRPLRNRRRLAAEFGPVRINCPVRQIHTRQHQRTSAWWCSLVDFGEVQLDCTASHVSQHRDQRTGLTPTVSVLWDPIPDTEIRWTMDPHTGK